jgi:tape measure domain-containing protein
MKFSAVLEVVTGAFNKGVKDASANYTASTNEIITQSEKVGKSTAEVSAKLKDVFQAKDAASITTALKSATAELDKTKQGASLTADELKRLGTAGKQATSQLTGELKLAQAELVHLQQTKATPTDLDAAQQKIAKLRTEIANSAATYAQFQASASAAMRRAAADTDTAAQQAKSAGKAIYDALNIKTGGQLRTEIAQITQQLQSFRANAGAPADEVKRVTEAASARIKELRNELDGVKPAGVNAAGGIGAIAGQLAGLAGITAGLAGVKQGIEAVLTATIKFESINKQLVYATGNAEEAAKAFDFVRQVTKDLGLELLSSAQGYAKLAAALKGTRLEGEGTQTLFKGIASAAASMGLSVDETNGVILALSQIASKGKVSMEELRGQLGERLGPAMKIAADSIGVTVAELDKMVEAGIDSTQFLEKFGPALVKAFGPTAAANAKTLNGQITLLKNQFTEILLALGTGEGGLGSAFASVLADIGAGITTIQEAMDSIDPRTIAAVKEVFSQLYGLIGDTFTTLMSAIADAAGAVQTLFDGVMALNMAFYGLDASTEQVSFLTSTLQGLSVVIGVLGDGVKAISILFTIAAGRVQELFSAIAYGLSKISFGQLSKDLLDFSNKLGTAAEESFAKADRAAMNFSSSAVAALDRAAGVVEQSGARIRTSAQQTANVQTAAAQQGADANAAAAKQGADAHTSANAQTQAGAKLTAQQIEAAAKQASSAVQAGMGDIKLASLGGEVATLKVATAAAAVADAFKTLAKESGISLPLTAKSAEDLAKAMSEVAVKSEAAAKAISVNLAEAASKLTGAQLVNFTKEFVDGLTKAGASTEYIAKQIQTLAGVAVKALGGDIAPALKQVSQEFKDQQAVINDLAKNYSVLQKSGVDASIALTQALEGMLAKSRNPVEIQELIKLWEQLGREGKISGDAMVDGLQRAKAKIDELKPGINSLAEAFKTMGLQTREEAQAIATKYAQAYAAIANSGQATTAQLRDAFQKYAQAAVDANGGVVSALVKVRGEALGLSVQADSTGKVIVSAMNSGAQAIAGVGSAAAAATGQVQSLGATVLSTITNLEQMFNKVNSLSTLSKNLDKDGFVTDSSGNRLTYSGQLKIPDGYYFDSEAANKDPRFQKGLIDGSEYIKPTAATQSQMNAAAAAATQAALAAMKANPRNYGNAGYSVFGEAAYKKAPPPPPPPAPPQLSPSNAGSAISPPVPLVGPYPTGAVLIRFVGADGKSAEVRPAAGTSVQDVIDTLRSAGATSIRQSS